MAFMTRRPSFRRSRGAEPAGDVSRLQFQVVLQLTWSHPFTEDEFEEALTHAVETLVTEARGLALGPVGGGNLETSTLELEFTVEAVSPAVFYAKMGEVLRVLERAGFEFESSKEERIPASRPGLELQPA